MLKRTAIRALCNTTAYQRGLDIYRTGKRIQSLDIKSEGAVDKISAAVKGSGRNVYNTGFQYDTEADRIKEAYCDCPAFRSYSGICKHCVAVLLEYGDRKAYERVEIRMFFRRLPVSPGSGILCGIGRKSRPFRPRLSASKTPDRAGRVRQWSRRRRRSCRPRSRGTRTSQARR